jgi:heme a synthase
MRPMALTSTLSLWSLDRYHKDTPRTASHGSRPRAEFCPPLRLAAVALPRLTSRAYLRLTQVVLVTCVVNVISGASVRLTESGLGCADWPTCTRSSVTPPLSFHPIMEFANRMVVSLLVVAVVIAFLGSFLRMQRRKDLVVLSGGLLVGVLAEAGVGALVVYSKLNPYVVMVHFLVGMALVTLSLVLAVQAGRARAPGTLKVTPRALKLSRLMIAVLVVVLAAGTATTGAGPHAGGPGAKRIPVPLADMARTHSSIVLVLGALLLVELWLLQRDAAPPSVVKRGQALLAVMVAQGLVGYTQYFTHEPALLVGIHVAGAVSVLLTMLWFYDGMYQHPAEALDDEPAVALGALGEQSPALAGIGSDSLAMGSNGESKGDVGKAPGLAEITP